MSKSNHGKCTDPSMERKLHEIWAELAALEKRIMGLENKDKKLGPTPPNPYDASIQLAIPRLKNKFLPSGY